MSPSQDPQPPTFDATTEAELDAAATITPEDVDRAVAQWRQDAPVQFRGLLDAAGEDTAS